MWLIVKFAVSNLMQKLAVSIQLLLMINFVSISVSDKPSSLHAYKRDRRAPLVRGRSLMHGGWTLIAYSSPTVPIVDASAVVMSGNRDGTMHKFKFMPLAMQCS